MAAPVLHSPLPPAVVETRLQGCSAVRRIDPAGTGSRVTLRIRHRPAPWAIAAGWFGSLALVVRVAMPALSNPAWSSALRLAFLAAVLALLGAGVLLVRAAERRRRRAERALVAELHRRIADRA